VGGFLFYNLLLLCYVFPNWQVHERKIIVCGLTIFGAKVFLAKNLLQAFLGKWSHSWAMTHNGTIPWPKASHFGISWPFWHPKASLRVISSPPGSICASQGNFMSPPKVLLPWPHCASHGLPPHWAWQRVKNGTNLASGHTQNKILLSYLPNSFHVWDLLSDIPRPS